MLFPNTTFTKIVFVTAILLIFVVFPCQSIISPSTKKDSQELIRQDRVIHMLVLDEYLFQQDAIELCSVYSVAISNPERSVIVHTRYVLPDAILWSNLSNVFVVKINDSTVCADTPAQNFYQKFLQIHLNTSIHAIAELSDILRYCIIFKFGGIYVDTDVISLKPFPEDNFIATSYLFAFDAGNLNLRDMLTQLESGYVPGSWGTVGPIPFARVFKNDSNSNDTFLPNHLFAPILWEQALDMFMNVSMADKAMKTITANETISVHIYRALLAFGKVQWYSADSALGRLIKDRCLPVFSAKMRNQKFTFTRAIEKV
jgi:hypothetical protein